MSDLPSEIYLEILRRVPVESIFRFRCVCKTWRQIIDDPAFSKQHKHCGIGGPVFFHRHNKGGKIFLLPFRELSYSNRRINCVNATHVKTIGGRGVPRILSFPVASCNGLILLSHVRNNMVWRIWNPFTGESLELRQCHELANESLQGGVTLCSGIGYDEANDDYKVVSSVKLNTYIYSVNTGKWRRIGDFPNSINIGNLNGVFAYGALHWVVHSMEVNGEWIVAIDLSTGKYRKIELPQLPVENRFSMGLYALSGCLFLSCSGLRGHFVVWMIEDYGCKDTWIKMISLENRNPIIPLAYLRSKEQVLLHCKYKHEYLWYDVKKKCADRLDIEVTADGTFSSQVIPASLIRLKKSDGSGEVVSSQGTSKRKRKRATAIERLPLKLLFEDHKDRPYDEPT